MRVLLQYAILDKLEAVQTISGMASKEYSLEKVLEKMENDWQGVEFRIIEYKDTGGFPNKTKHPNTLPRNVMTGVAAVLRTSKRLTRMSTHMNCCVAVLLYCRTAGTYIMGGADEVQALLDDQIVKAQAMRASPFIKPLEARAVKWEALLLNLQVGRLGVGLKAVRSWLGWLLPQP